MSHVFAFFHNILERTKKVLRLSAKLRNLVVEEPCIFFFYQSSYNPGQQKCISSSDLYDSGECRQSKIGKLQYIVYAFDISATRQPVT